MQTAVRAQRICCLSSATARARNLVAGRVGSPRHGRPQSDNCLCGQSTFCVSVYQQWLPEVDQFQPQQRGTGDGRHGTKDGQFPKDFRQRGGPPASHSTGWSFQALHLHLLHKAQHSRDIRSRRKDSPLPQGAYILMLAFAIFLELAGGLLLIFNSTLGAVLLVSVLLCQLLSLWHTVSDELLMQSWFMIAVTPVMHNFWDERENSQGRLNETINFFKVRLLCCSLTTMSCPDFCSLAIGDCRMWPF